MKKLVLMLVAMAALGAFAEIAVKNGETMAFLGDSITANGQRNPDGYVNLVLRALQSEGIAVKAVKAGVSGNESDDMLRRLDKDVLSQHPQWMTLSCGVNDVWHQDRKQGVSLADYQKNITKILDKCEKAHCRVIVLTATMFEHDGLEKNPHNVKLAPYNEWLRAEAKRRGLPLADLNAMMWKAHEGSSEVQILTRDGVHMLPAGDRVMAKGILQAIGVEDFANIEQNGWKDVWVLCRFDLKPDTDLAAYIATTKAIVGKVRAEPGCREYRLLGDAQTDWDKPQRLGERTLIMIEHWDSLAALKAHLATPHMQEFGPKVRPLRALSTFHVLEDVAD